MSYQIRTETEMRDQLGLEPDEVRRRFPHWDERVDQDGNRYWVIDHPLDGRELEE